MNAKSKANFINSVASGTNIPCPKCGAGNKSDSKFCISCGVKITIFQENADNAPAFESVKATATPVEFAKYMESNNEFAQGLPEWSIEPPQVMVRRH